MRGVDERKQQRDGNGIDAVFTEQAHHLAHAFNAVSGHEHFDHALVFRACPLGGQAQAQRIAGHKTGVDYCRGVVARIFAIKQWLRHTGFAQVTIHIASAHALIDGVFKRAAHNAHILPHIGKNHGKAGILANGNAVAGCD